MGIEALKYISYPAQYCSNSDQTSKGIVAICKACISSILDSAHQAKLINTTLWKFQLFNGFVGEDLPKGKSYIYIIIVLAKSTKMIPVMLMGTLVYGIKYTIPEYICTFLVAGGVSSFSLSKTSSKTVSKLARPNAPLGHGLCFLNLAFDGFTNATQDSIKARYPETTAWDIMLGMNRWGTIYNVIYMFGWPHGSGYEAVRFCQEHPEAAWDILVYCLCGAVVSSFGTLANTTITTTRKFVSIVVSSLISGNPLSPKHWASVVMVFSGLSLQIFLKWRKIQRTKKGRKAA